jgi:hypothetical protein
VTRHILKQNKDVIFRKEEEDAILFNPESSEIILINATGCRVWDLMESGLAKNEIAAMLLDIFKVSPARVKADLDIFLADLEKGNFITLMDAHES